MSISTRSVASRTVKVSRQQVRPVASLQKAAIVTALVASIASVAAPVEAASIISTVASAAEGYPFVPPSWAPSVFVPLTGLVLPGVAMASLFVYIEKEAPAK